MLKIYGRANSINVRKVLWAAAEIGLAYEREDWGRGFQPTDLPDFQAVSKFGVIPVIEDDGLVLRESNTIVRYLATKHGREDLMPTDLERRFAVEAWMDWASTDVYQEVRPVFQGLVFKLPEFDDPKIIANGIRAWTRQMARLDQYFAEGRDHMMAHGFSVADIPIGLMVNRWFATPFDKETFDHVSAYYERLKQRPAYQAHGANGTP